MEQQNLNQEMKGGKKTDYEFVVQIIFISVLALLLTYNIGKIYGGNGSSSITGAVTSVTGIGTVSALDVSPKGVPEIYGSELGVSYDDVSPNNPQLADATIEKLSQYEDDTLSSDLMTRYIKIGSSISCEYCCGAQAIIFSNGQRACGCAHSYAMRGLAKYLLKNHADMTDDAILEELGKWKVLFFPGVHSQKAEALKLKGVELNYINLASNKYRGAEKGQSSGSGGAMVGGC